MWELYHVAEDFSEVHDLAAERPDKLAELQALWWQEAEKYQVLPLNNQPGRFGDTRYRRDRYEFYGGIGPLPEAIAPNLRNRSFTIAAELDIPDDGCDRRRDRRARGARRRLRRVRAGPPAALRVQLRRYRDHDDRGNRGAPDRAGRGAHRLQSGAR